MRRWQVVAVVVAVVGAWLLLSNTQSDPPTPDTPDPQSNDAAERAALVGHGESAAEEAVERGEATSAEGTTAADPRSNATLRVTVESADGEPQVGVKVHAGWHSPTGKIQRTDQLTGEDGTAYFDPVPNRRVFVTARSPDRGVSGDVVWAPGDVTLVLQRGPRVTVDASAIPAGRRALLRIGHVSMSGRHGLPVKTSLASGQVDLGIWPPGAMDLWVSDAAGTSMLQSFLLPDADAVTLPVVWPAPEDAPALRLGDGSRGWSLRVSQPGRGLLSEMTSNSEGLVAFPWGLPRYLARAEAEGLAPVVFMPEALPRREGEVRVIPTDPGCMLTLDLRESGLPSVDLVLLRHVAPGHTPLPRGGQWPDVSIQRASRPILDPTMVLAQYPARAEQVVRIRVPSRSKLGVYGSDGTRRVKTTFETGDPGTPLEVVVQSGAAATIRIEGGRHCAGGKVLLDQKPIDGRVQLNSGVTLVLDGEGAGRVSGIPVPFKCELSVELAERRWTKSVLIEQAEDMLIRVEAMDALEEHRHEVVVTDVDRQPIEGAVVHWLGRGGLGLASRTDDSGRAAVSTSRQLSAVSVYSSKFESSASASLARSGPTRVTIAPGVVLRVRIGDRFVGRRIEVRAFRSGRPKGGVKTLVLGAGEFRMPVVTAGAYTVKLLSEDGEELAAQEVTLHGGEPAVIEFD